MGASVGVESYLRRCSGGCSTTHGYPQKVNTLTIAMAGGRWPCDPIIRYEGRNLGPDSVDGENKVSLF